MKFRNVLLVMISLIVVNCNNNSVVSYDNTQDSYLGSLSRGAEDLAQIESSPPSGTKYGHGNNVWTATGGEYLKDGYYAKNIYGSDFEVFIFSEVVVSYASASYIYVDNPVGVRYKHQSSGWQTLSSAGYITTDSLLTNSSGSCSVIGDDELEIGGLPGNA